MSPTAWCLLLGLQCINQEVISHVNIPGYFFSITASDEMTMTSGRGCQSWRIAPDTIRPVAASAHHYLRRNEEETANVLHYVARWFALRLGQVAETRILTKFLLFR